MSKKKSAVLYRFLAWLVRLFTPKMKTIGTEHLPDEPVVFVGNHCQMYGPIVCEFYLPVERFTWCAGQMMNVKEVPDYAFEDFWSQKPKYIRWFYRLASYLVAPISAYIFHHANTIAVYRDTRVISTFKETVKKLKNGYSIVIFPEHNMPHDHIIYDFERNFVDIAKLYYKATGKRLSFVPMYIAPKLGEIHLGVPIRFSPDRPLDEERDNICAYLMGNISNIARSLPEHVVIPYRNIPKKYYPLNTAERSETLEKTGR